MSTNIFGLKITCSENLSQNRPLVAQINVVGSFTGSIGSVQELAVFRIPEENFNDLPGTSSHGDVKCCIAFFIRCRYLRLFIQEQLDDFGISRSDSFEKGSVSVLKKYKKKSKYS